MRILLLLLISNIAFANSINVGIIKDTEPFIIQEGIRYSGISHEVVDNFLYTYDSINYIEFNNSQELINNIDSIDIGLGNITITADRYNHVNFSQPYYTSTVSVASNKNAGDSYTDLMLTFFKENIVDLLISIINLLIFCFIFGIIIWLIERGENDHFQNNKHGLVDAFYYSVIIFTTVGFGDRTAKTVTGKLVSIVYAVLCLCVSSILIANIYSSIVEIKGDTKIECLSDLNKLKVGTVKNTACEILLDNKDVKYLRYDTPTEGLLAIKNGELDAFVFDTPILNHIIKTNNYDDIVLSVNTYDPQYYGVVVNKKFNNIRKLNASILTTIELDKWEKYLK